MKRRSAEGSVVVAAGVEKAAGRESGGDAFTLDDYSVLARLREEEE